MMVEVKIKYAVFLFLMAVSFSTIKKQAILLITFEKYGQDIVIITVVKNSFILDFIHFFYFV